MASGFPTVQKALLTLCNFGGHTTATFSTDAGYKDFDAAIIGVKWPTVSDPGSTRNNFFKLSTPIDAADFAEAKSHLITAAASANSSKGFYIGMQFRADNSWAWASEAFWDNLKANFTTLIQECVVAVNAAAGFRFVRGAMFETETYEGQIWNYSLLANNGGLSFAAMCEKIRSRAQDLGTTIWTLDPQFEIIHSCGYLQARQSMQGSGGASRSTVRYGMLPYWIDGLCDAKVSFGSAYLSEYFQKAYDVVTASNFQYYVTNPTNGYTTLRRNVDYFTSNFSQHKFDFTVWPDNRARDPVQDAYVNTNSVVIGNVSGDNNIPVNDDIWCVDSNGLEQVRRVTSRVGFNVTFSGDPITIDALTIVCPRTPSELRESIRNALTFGTGRRGMLYFQSGNPHRVTSTIPKWPEQWRNAVFAGMADVAPAPPITTANPITDALALSITDMGIGL